MKQKLQLVAVSVFTGFMGVSVPTFAQTGALTNAPVSGAGQNMRNEYILRCATCHGMNGEGTAKDWPATGPALKGNPFVMNAPVAAITNVIRKGRNGRQRLYKETYPNMPAFDSQGVSDADALVAFLKGGLQK